MMRAWPDGYIFFDKENRMTIYQLLCLIGFPAIVLGMIGMISKCLKSNDMETKSVQMGVQALLRDRLFQSFNHYLDKGYAPLYARENFENMYRQYHVLGANGVMDDIYKKFMELPTDKDDV